MRRLAWFGPGATLLLLCAPSSGQTQTNGSETLLGEAKASLRDVARQINNPISPLWQVTFDNAIVGMDGGGLDDELGYTATFQPFMPVRLSELGLARFAWARDFRLVTQLTVPFFETMPLPPAPDSDDRAHGFGDIQLASVLAPSGTPSWLWGIGPTFIFPSATDDALGQEKWQIGPAFVAGYQGSEWSAFVIGQQWWSFAGNDDRSRVSQLSLEYGLLRNLAAGWQLGMQPTMQVDWTESRDDKVLFPVGLGVGKTVKIGSRPVQFWIEADYYAVRPDAVSAPRWGIDFQIIPVIGELF